MMDRWRCHRGRAHFAVRGEHLLDRTEGAAAELARHRVGAVQVRIDHAQQSNGYSLLLKLVINPGVVASKDAHSYYRNGNRIVSLQEGTLGWPVATWN
jgi:hypothetical protein